MCGFLVRFVLNVIGQIIMIFRMLLERVGMAFLVLNFHFSVVTEKVLNVVRRLLACQKAWKKWASKRFPDTRKKILRLKMQLSILKEAVWTEESISRAESLMKEIEDAWKIEEKLWGQQSHVK